MTSKNKVVFGATTRQGVQNLNDFVKLLKKRGIDPSTIDLVNYDFDSFENLTDLLRHYAIVQKDPLAAKLLTPTENEEMQKWESQYLQYVDYMANNENENVDNNGNDIIYKINLLENSIAAIQNKIEELSSLSQLHNQLDTIKMELHNLQNNGKNNEILGRLEEKLRSIEDKLEAMHGPGRQTTLTGPPITRRPKDQQNDNMVTAKIISIIKTLVIATILVVVGQFADPYTPIDAITGSLLVIIAFASDFITSYGIYALFSGNRKASPNGMLWSRGRRVNMRR